MRPTQDVFLFSHLQREKVIFFSPGIVKWNNDNESPKFQWLKCCYIIMFWSMARNEVSEASLFTLGLNNKLQQLGGLNNKLCFTVLEARKSEIMVVICQEFSPRLADVVVLLQSHMMKTVHFSQQCPILKRVLSPYITVVT